MVPRPTYPKMYHSHSVDKVRSWKGKAKHYTRTTRPVKYYLIDFGLSRRYAADDISPFEVQIPGGDRTVPEFRTGDGEVCNPFPTDIYYVGNMIREHFLQKLPGFEFMAPLIADMMQEDPRKRPTVDENVDRFQQLRLSLSGWTLQSHLASVDENLSDAEGCSISSVRPFIC